MFDAKSRYAQQEIDQVADRRGRTVAVVVPPEAPAQVLRGYHLRRQGQRLDHMAFKHLKNAAGFWRICELNDVMQAEMLSEADEIAIPLK
jgi:hypothetical protein